MKWKEVLGIVVTVSIVVIVIVFTLIPASITKDNHILTNITSFVTISVFTSAPITYFGKLWWNKKKNIREVSKILSAELDDALKALDGSEGYQVMEVIIEEKIKGKILPKITKKYYTQTYMNYDMYDSLISSGDMQVLDYKLQQKIQNVFRRIKTHTERLKYTEKLRDDAKINDKNVDHTTTPIYGHIADIEIELEDKLIPNAQKELKKSF